MREQVVPEISVVLPTYNERSNIIDFILEIDLYISRYLKNPLEIIVVDDDSPDQTGQEVESYFSADKRIKLIRRTGRRCLASSIREGIKLTQGEYVVWMDCDFSMPPYKVVELLEKVIGGYDIAVGSRFIKGGRDIRGATDSLLAAVLSRLMNLFITLMLGYSFKDYTSGFVAARKGVLDKIKIRGDYGEYFIDFIYQSRKHNFKIIEVPYYCVPRRKGFSKTGTNLWDYLKKGWIYLTVTLKLKTIPFNSKEQR